MGAIYADIDLTNEGEAILARRGYLDSNQVRKKTVRMLADSGVTALVIPKALADELGLETVGRKWVALADGSLQDCDMVGPIKVEYEGRSMIGSAVAIPSDDAQILLGQVQMEEMDLVLDPLAQKLIPNPASPDRARLMAVGVRVLGTSSQQ